MKRAALVILLPASGRAVSDQFALDLPTMPAKSEDLPSRVDPRESLQ